MVVTKASAGIIVPRALKSEKESYDLEFSGHAGSEPNRSDTQRAHQGTTLVRMEKHQI